MFYITVIMAVGIAIYVSFFMNAVLWCKRNTEGNAYFSRILSERINLKNKIAQKAKWVMPLYRLKFKIFPLKQPPFFLYKGVAGPQAASSKEACAKAENYQPTRSDIFVATQMKCGTTWMQQIVFEILHKGEGDLSDNGYRSMYALSPWIEGTLGVSLENAPLVSKYQKRIIKTHLPAQLCPYSPEAKYIYVTRHPVSCFVSIVDFIASSRGPIKINRENYLQWFCSDKMYCMNWAKNVDSWWRLSQRCNNVIFVHFETMKDDLRSVIEQIASFLGISLTENEKIAILEKCSFAYMKKHEYNFEMLVPTFFSPILESGNCIKSGAKNRYKDATEVETKRIVEYIKSELKNCDYPAHKFYPDLALK